MEYSRFGNTIYLRLDPKEEILEEIGKVAEKENIRLAQVTGLGAINDFTAGVYNTVTKEYHSIQFQEAYEIVSLTGTVTRKDGEVYLHLHIAAGDEEGHVHGGHLNRAIIIEREAAEKYGWEEVCVVPRPHAGGSWATTCWKKFREPVAVEEIRAHAGIDIGGTLIGMHLKRVAVPVRLSLSKIGEANILCARTRPKLIGGERAKYTEED